MTLWKDTLRVVKGAKAHPVFTAIETVGTVLATVEVVHRTGLPGKAYNGVKEHVVGPVGAAFSRAFGIGQDETSPAVAMPSPTVAAARPAAKALPAPARPAPPVPPAAVGHAHGGACSCGGTCGKCSTAGAPAAPTLPVAGYPVQWTVVGAAPPSAPPSGESSEVGDWRSWMPNRWGWHRREWGDYRQPTGWGRWGGGQGGGWGQPRLDAQQAYAAGENAGKIIQAQRNAWAKRRAYWQGKLAQASSDQQGQIQAQIERLNALDNAAALTSTYVTANPSSDVATQLVQLASQPQQIEALFGQFVPVPDPSLVTPWDGSAVDPGADLGSQIVDSGDGTTDVDETVTETDTVTQGYEDAFFTAGVVDDIETAEAIDYGLTCGLPSDRVSYGGCGPCGT